MRVDADFLSYVEARWPSLVRDAARLGAPEDLAPQVALEALAHCERDWADIQATFDVDAEVGHQLAAAWERLRRTLPETPPPLPPETIEAMVVLAAPDHAEIERHRRVYEKGQRRRRLRVALPVALVVALVVGFLAWRGSRTHHPPADALPRLAVQKADNPANIVWYARDVLHLAHVETQLGGIVELVGFGTGAVYVDLDGRVIYLRDDGERTLLGRTDPGAHVAVSAAEGWAAWVDHDSTPRSLVVVRVESHRLVGRETIDRASQTRLVAIDGDAIYYNDVTGAHAWHPAAVGQATLSEPIGLLDVARPTRVSQPGPGLIRVATRVSGTVHTLDLLGTGADLADDGSFVLTRRDQDRGPPGGQMIVYESATGAELDTGVAVNEVVRQAVTGPDRTVSYLVQTTGSDLELRTCRIEPLGQNAECTNDVKHILIALGPTALLGD